MWEVDNVGGKLLKNCKFILALNVANCEHVIICDSISGPDTCHKYDDLPVKKNVRYIQKFLKRSMKKLNIKYMIFNCV